MKISLIVITTFIILCAPTISFPKAIPFTQDDRDRLIRLETKLEEGLKATNQRIDDLNKRIDDLNRRVEEGFKATNQRIDDLNRRIDGLQTFMLWGFGILFGGMGILIGFVIWDRRTALAPAIKKYKELEEKEEKIEKVLKELAEKDPKIAEALKHVGLL